jgi:hypothetical protein
MCPERPADFLVELRGFEPLTSHCSPTVRFTASSLLPSVSHPS